MVKIQEKFFLKIPVYKTDNEEVLQENFKEIERTFNRLEMPDTPIPVPAVGGALDSTGGDPDEWSVLVDGVKIVIVGNELTIPADAITLANMANASVGSNELIDGAVTNTKLGAGSVTASKIQAGAVGTTEIAVGGVTASNLATNSVGADEIVNDSITATEIAANAVGSLELATDAVTNVKVANDAITANELANLACSAAACGGDWPSFGAYKSSSQSIPSGSLTPISFSTGTELWDIGNWHSSTTSVWNAPQGANYIFAGSLRFAASFADVFAGVSISANGSEFAWDQQVVNFGTTPVFSCAGVFRAAAGVDIQLNAFQLTGGSINVIEAYMSAGFMGN